MLHPVLTAIGLHSLQLACHSPSRAEESHEVVQRRDAGHRQPKALRNLLNRRGRAAAPLHPVQSDDHSARGSPGARNDVDGLPHRGPGRDHVIDDQHATDQRGTDQLTALAMILDLLSIKGDRHIAPIFGKANSGGCDERYALIGRAEQLVEGDARSDYGLGIKLSESAQRFTIAEQPRIEKVRRLTSSLRYEIAEAQHLLLQREGEKFLAKVQAGST